MNFPKLHKLPGYYLTIWNTYMNEKLTALPVKISAIFLKKINISQCEEAKNLFKVMLTI